MSNPNIRFISLAVSFLLLGAAIGSAQQTKNGQNTNSDSISIQVNTVSNELVRQEEPSSQPSLAKDFVQNSSDVQQTLPFPETNQLAAGNQASQFAKEALSGPPAAIGHAIENLNISLAARVTQNPEGSVAILLDFGTLLLPEGWAMDAIALGTSMVSDVLNGKLTEEVMGNAAGGAILDLGGSQGAKMFYGSVTLIESLNDSGAQASQASVESALPVTVLAPSSDLSVRFADANSHNAADDGIFIENRLVPNNVQGQIGDVPNGYTSRAWTSSEQPSAQSNDNSGGYLSQGDSSQPQSSEGNNDATRDLLSSWAIRQALNDSSQRQNPPSQNQQPQQSSRTACASGGLGGNCAKPQQSPSLGGNNVGSRLPPSSKPLSHK